MFALPDLLCISISLSLLLEKLARVLPSLGPTRAIDYRTTNPVTAAVRTALRQVSECVQRGHDAHDLAGPPLHARATDATTT